LHYDSAIGESARQNYFAIFAILCLTLFAIFANMISTNEIGAQHASLSTEHLQRSGKDA
jgi:hypothetical protein